MKEKINYGNLVKISDENLAKISGGYGFVHREGQMTPEEKIEAQAHPEDFYPSCPKCGNPDADVDLHGNLRCRKCGYDESIIY